MQTYLHAQKTEKYIDMTKMLLSNMSSCSINSYRTQTNVLYHKAISANGETSRSR